MDIGRDGLLWKSRLYAVAVSILGHNLLPLLGLFGVQRLGVALLGQTERRLCRDLSLLLLDILDRVRILKVGRVLTKNNGRGEQGSRRSEIAEKHLEESGVGAREVMNISWCPEEEREEKTWMGT